ncbi:hypothetical protein F4804DRAFT_328649 [Jackrogersella minutella]|nr:hypothetical protein F4804DRAFT_328649 [Jackrogersella minutella]
MPANNLSAPVHQRFETLTRAPPLPITEITRSFIEKLAHIPVKSYINQIVSIFKLGLPQSTTKPVTQSPAPKATPTSSAIVDGRNTTISSPNPLIHDHLRRQDDMGSCGPGNPCADGSCCNTSGGCGYGAANCGKGNCTSNCEFDKHAPI